MNFGNGTIFRIGKASQASKVNSLLLFEFRFVNSCFVHKLYIPLITLTVEDCMFNRRAFGRLKVILLIDILIVAIAAGSYLYLSSQGALNEGPSPAEFVLSDLTIDPNQTDAGSPISVSVNITNVGETEGNYTFELFVNDLTKANATVDLVPLESNVTTFTDLETVAGNYTVQIGNLTGAFNVTPAAPETSSIVLSTVTAGFLVDGVYVPYEGWVSQPVIVKAIATNPSSAADSLSVKLNINNAVVATKRVDLEPGQSAPVEFNYNVSSEGIYNVRVNTQTTGFIVVPTGYHNLLVVSSPKQGIDFKIDGVPFKTPHTELLSVSTPHTVEFPAADPTGKFGFLQWEASSPPLPGDGSTNPSRQVTVTTRLTVKGSFSGGSSCPSLYSWNGKEWTYVGEISDHGWLGYIDAKNSSNPAVPFTFYANNPWDYIPLNGGQAALVDGSYVLKLNQKWNEIFYLDQAYMVVVDHPSDVNVYSTMVEQYLDPAYMGKIYTVSKDLLSPVSAVNEKGQNVLPQISKIDNVFTPGVNGLSSPSWDNIQWNTLTLNLGDLSNAKQIKLVVTAVVDWGSPDDYSNWLGRFFDTSVPDGAQVTPPPFMEVKAANGSWVRVPMDRQFPIPPETVPRTYVVDLTGLFPTNDYSLRISNFWNVTFDYIGIDTSPQSNITIRTIDPTAQLYQAFSTGSASSGNFTRYGDVTKLVAAEDDEFVIGRQGDEVSLNFSTTNLPPLDQGMQRDYFVFASCWFKDESGNWGFGFGFTVDPLPFRNMTSFPYPLKTENYPSDAAHEAYLRDFNTRVLPLQSEGTVTPLWIPIAVIAITMITVTNAAAFIRVKKQKQPTLP